MMSLVNPFITEMLAVTIAQEFHADKVAIGLFDDKGPSMRISFVVENTYGWTVGGVVKADKRIQHNSLTVQMLNIIEQLIRDLREE